MSGRLPACRLAIKVVPGSSRDKIVGWLGDDLKVRVRQPPEKGRANKAVCELITALLGLPADAVAVVAGEHSPRKTVEIRGLCAEDVRARVAHAKPAASRAAVLATVFFCCLAGPAAAETVTWMRCVKEAALNNPGIAAAVKEVERAIAVRKGAYSTFLPQVSLSAGIGRSFHVP